MIPLTAAVWYLVMPIWSVLDPDDWYEQRFQIVETEPTLEDLELKLRHEELMEQFRILENRNANR